MFRIDGHEITAFARQMENVPRELRRELRPHLRKAGERVVRSVRSNASWSSRIPGATKVRVGFSGGSRGGVQVYVDKGRAPHARPLEFGNVGNVNRHPVFGNTDIWVDQPTRPFFMPAVRENESQVVQEVQSAIDSVFDRL